MLDGANNNGYDDDQGSYVHVPHDHVAYRYEVLSSSIYNTTQYNLSWKMYGTAAILQSAL